MALLSERFHAELKNRIQHGERQYRIARRAGIHPTTLSQIIHDALPLHRGDVRVIKVGRELGLEPSECFEDVPETKAA